jgi:hypothetical protein
MRVISELITGLFLAFVLLAGFFTFVMVVSEPERKGSLAIAGAVLLGSTMITLTILNRADDSRR